MFLYVCHLHSVENEDKKKADLTVMLWF